MTSKVNEEEILKLAKLARIDISKEEAESLSNEFDSILKYVGEIKEAKIKAKEKSQNDYALRNVLREDDVPHESQIHTEKLLSEVPSRDKNFVKVKKIL